MASLVMLHPEFVRRNDMLVAECWANGWDVGYTRVYADYAAQKALWVLYRDGWTPIVAANPDAPGGLCPTELGEWRVLGSMHQVQADGWGHAVDYSFQGCTITQFHALAYRCGIRFPIWASLGEWWHAQWWDSATGVYPIPPSPAPPAPVPGPDLEVDDMATLVTPDDGDPAVFVTDGIVKSWVVDGDALAELRDKGFAKAGVGGVPVVLSRAAITSLALLGPAPRYDAGYTGPRTTR